MDLKLFLVKLAGGLVFSYSLAQLIVEVGLRVTTITSCNIKPIANCENFQFLPLYALPYSHLIFLMAAGLVLLAEDFSGCCKPAKDKK